MKTKEQTINDLINLINTVYVNESPVTVNMRKSLLKLSKIELMNLQMMIQTSK